MNIAGAHTEVFLNKLNKPELVQIILNIEANLESEIAKLTKVKELLAHSKKLEAHVTVVRNLNSKLVERAVAIECQCWENAQYLRRDTLEVVGIPVSVRDSVLEQKVCDMFQEIAMDICDCDIQACHRLKDKDRTIFKFTIRKDYLRILSVKRQLEGLDLAAVDLPEGTKISVNESLCPYYWGICNKCKKLKDKNYINIIQ